MSKGRRRFAAKQVECPRCGAAAGTACVGSRGERRAFHVERHRAAEAVGLRASKSLTATLASRGGALGFDKLVGEWTADLTKEIRAYLVQEGVESEIERLFVAALSLEVRFGAERWFEHLEAIDALERDHYLDHGSQYERSLIVETQAQVGRYRVDFIIYAWTHGSIHRGGRVDTVAPGWRRLIVECDGHEFHERTKAQAARDRSRDRSLALLGYEVFRFTGSELWRDPRECAAQVIDWAMRGVS